MISFEQLKPQFTQVSGLPVSRIAQKVGREIKVYTLEDHLRKTNDVIKITFEKLQQAVLGMNPQIKEKVKKHYIAYEMNSNFTEFVIQSSAIKVYLDIPINELRDPAHIAEDCSKVGHWATGNARFKVHLNDEVTQAVELIRQAYERNLRL